MSQTLRCIECLREATHWSGHVLRGERKVLAGWCDTHSTRGWRTMLGARACFGGWHKKLGDTFRPRRKRKP